jgi:hypothetical protein
MFSLSLSISRSLSADASRFFPVVLSPARPVTFKIASTLRSHFPVSISSLGLSKGLQLMWVHLCVCVCVQILAVVTVSCLWIATIDCGGFMSLS